MRPRPSHLSGFLAIVLCLALVSCGQSDVTLTLDLVVTAADAALTTLEGSGQVSASTAGQVNSYLTQVTNAVTFTTTELASSDSDAIKSTKIAAEFASVIAPNLPGGTALEIVAVVGAVAKSVTNFLALMSSTSAQLRSAEGNAFFAAAKGWKLSKGDQKALPKIAAKAAALRKRLQSVKK
jgi:hypothetical protein